MYQVLARKWRPKNFHELVGQTHVTQALSYALDNDHLHHAYLFTGTRGVGKTTIARIFAKSLNCLTNGVSSNPCGKCVHCLEIDQGRFPDLIEVDAASRTGVDDTRELLDNVPYAPVKARYKVYLIDEVHMFSKSSFNALLKTLEEPPSHVKFILATTDPQKLPATVLSRCLQFHLKNMSEYQLIEHMQKVLEGEAVVFEEDALQLMAQAANGSIRDSLSLLDQAIAFGQGRIKVDEVASLLGAVPITQLHRLLKALVLGDAQALRQLLYEIDEFSPDYSDILSRLLEQFQQITIAQLNAERELGEVSEFIRGLAEALPVELIQLWYQIATDTWRNMPYHPNARMALEMGLLRMIALQPVMPQMDLSQVKVIPEVQEPMLVDGIPKPLSELAIELQARENESVVAKLPSDCAGVRAKPTTSDDVKQQSAVSDKGEKKNDPIGIDTGNVLTKESIAGTQSEVDLSPEYGDSSEDNEPVFAEIGEEIPPWGETTLENAQHVMQENEAAATDAFSQGQITEQKEIKSVTNGNVRDINPQKASAVASTQADEAKSFSDMNQELSACVSQPERWDELIKMVNLSQEAMMLAQFSMPSVWSPPVLTLSYDKGNEIWFSDSRRQALTNELSRYFNAVCQIALQAEDHIDTPSKRRIAKEEARLAKARQEFSEHPMVLQAKSVLNAVIDSDSIHILDESKE